MGEGKCTHVANGGSTGFSGRTLVQVVGYLILFPLYVPLQLIPLDVLPYIENVSGDGFVTSSQVRFLAMSLLLILGSLKTKCAVRVISSGVTLVQTCLKIGELVPGGHTESVIIP